jgi:two-component system sensor histidine kinase YesM
VEGVIRNLEYAGNTVVVMTNPTVATIAAAETLSIQHRIDVENQLSFILGVFPSIAQGWLVFPGKPPIGFGRIAADDESIVSLAGTMLRDDEPMGPNRLSGSRTDQIGGSILILAKRVIDIPTGRPLADLILAADAASFSDTLRRPDAEFTARFRLVDDKGVLVGAMPEETASNRYTEFEASLGNLPWRVVSSVPRRAVTVHTERVLLISAISLLVSSLAAVAAALVLSRTITRPLEALEKQMQEIDIEQGEGRLDVPGGWEVQHVADGANRLLQRVHALVARVAREERERQRYHLELLQAQIKPHFLYNSLEMVHMLGETGRWRRAQRSLRALSDFYRLSLASGREMVPLVTELELTEHYLFVQHLRYHNQFTYTVVRNGADAIELEIPKLTIQPLVENAIYHGIKGLDRVCHIDVGVDVAFLPHAAGPGIDPGTTRVPGTVQITVADDGRGIDGDHLDALRELRTEGSFGFASVIQRLRLHLGHDVTFSIDAAPDRGTTVTITIACSPTRE